MFTETVGIQTTESYQWVQLKLQIPTVLNVLSVGRHVCMFVVDDTVKTKRFFIQQRKIYRSSRLNREFFTFSQRERFVPLLSSSKNSDRVHEHFDLVEVIM